MNKKVLLITLATLALTTATGLLVTNGSADGSSKYTKTKEIVKNEKQIPDPKGNVPKMADVDYKANKDVAKDKLKKFEELPGVATDQKLADDGGRYTLKKVMTYQQYVDLGITQGIAHDIDPDRLVWVVQSKHSKTIQVNGYPVEKATLTRAYDAETGEFLESTVSSDDPHGMDQVKRP